MPRSRTSEWNGRQRTVQGFILWAPLEQSCKSTEQNLDTQYVKHSLIGMKAYTDEQGKRNCLLPIRWADCQVDVQKVQLLRYAVEECIYHVGHGFIPPKRCNGGRRRENCRERIGYQRVGISKNASSSKIKTPYRTAFGLMWMCHAWKSKWRGHRYPIPMIR